MKQSNFFLSSLFVPLAVLARIVSAQETAKSGSAATTMKAIRVSAYGGLDVLKYEDVPRPEQ